MRRVATNATVAASVGLLVALLSSMAFDPFALMGEWGIRNGLVAAAIAFLIVVGRGRRWPGIVARWLLVAALGRVAYGGSWWTVATATPPWSPEGAWLWPATMLAVGGWALAVRWAWRRRHGGPISP